MTMDKRRLLSAAALAAGVILAAGCAPSIRSERDENIPVPQGATWAWAGAGGTAQRDSAARGRYIPDRFTAGSSDAIVQQRLRRAVDAALRARGFRKAGDSAQADFLVSVALTGSEAYRHPPVAPAAVSVGFYGGWGYRPWGFGRPWGFYRPWGWYPWGWSYGFAGYPVYGYYGAYPYGDRYYRDGWLVVELRLRSDGEVAWIGRYRTEEHRVREMPQAKVQEVVNQVFETLH
jgi:hypothetical protein